MGGKRTTPIRARRWVRIALGAAIAGNLIGAGGAMYMLSGGSHDLTVDEAVQRYRASNPASSVDPSTVPTPSTVAKGPAASPSGPAKNTGPKPKGKTTTTTTIQEPALGVYVYETDGYEETDALAGQHHDYPAETTITISRHGCGLRYRWQPLKERWEETDGCHTSAGIALNRFAIYHEFFKSGQLEDFDLDPNSVVMPEEPVVGKSWHWKGHSDDSAIDTLTTVIGFETIAVGSKQVRTLHIRYETAMTGANEGTQTMDRWMTEDTGLLVRMINAVDATVALPFGGKAGYRERYRIDLTSTTPAA